MTEGNPSFKAREGWPCVSLKKRLWHGPVENAARCLHRHGLWRNFALLLVAVFCHCSAETSTNRTVTIMEAVRQTLAHDPNIQIQEQQVTFAKGVTRAASGQFDVSLDSA